MDEANFEGSTLGGNLREEFRHALAQTIRVSILLLMREKQDQKLQPMNEEIKKLRNQRS